MSAVTTRASTRTDEESDRAGVTHVRWVFPSSALLAVEGRKVAGRDESCDFVLVGDEASRRHAEIWRDGPLVVITDLESRNGVTVNGAREKESPLVAGDVIRCGEWVGVAVSEPVPAELSEIAPSWFGGAVLQGAVAPARRLKLEVPVVIQGETGTGKEGMARGLHAWSGRAGPFLAINCAALPAQLVESELFGYHRGAFTGAEAASLGLFRAAEGGTLLLDELTDLPLETQAKLLRVLEQREVVPLGSSKPVPIDVRILAATQEPLEDAVKDGRFRADLLARLDGLRVKLPPLRARREDIVPLFTRILREVAGESCPALDPKFVERLTVYDWPLNVRELRSLATQLVAVYGDERVFKRAHLPERILGRAVQVSERPVASREKRAWRRTDDEQEMEALVAALRENGGTVSRAAKAMGIPRGRVYRLLEAQGGAHPSGKKAT